MKHFDEAFLGIRTCKPCGSASIPAGAKVEAGGGVNQIDSQNIENTMNY